MAEANDSEITFTELDPTPKEKDQTKVSFEDLTIETPKTPDVVHEIIKLKQQEAEQSIKDQLPLPSRESSSFSTKDSARSSETVNQTTMTNTTRSVLKSGSSTNSKSKPKPKTPISGRTPPVSSRKTPDTIPKQTSKITPGKDSFTPRSRNMSTGKIQLSPIQSHNSSSRDSSRSRTFTNTPAASPSVSIDMSEREHTTDCEGLTCTPCENQDAFHEAQYWCRDCNEALCESCSDHHKSLRISKTHKLIRISETDEMPFSLKINEHCSFHKHKKFEFVCSEHDVPICAQCVTSTHKFCSDVQTVDDAAQKSLSFTDIKLISEKLKVWSQMVDKLQIQRARNITELDLQRSTIEKEIKRFRDDLVKHFDAMQQKSLDELADVYAKNMKEIQRQNGVLQERQLSLGDMQKDIKMMQNYASQHQVFLGTRELKEKQANEMKLLKVFEGQFNLVSLEFVVINFMDLPLKVEKFGLIRSNVKPMPLSLDIQFDKKDVRKLSEKQPVVTTMPSNIVLKSKVCFSMEKGGNFNFIRGGTMLPDGRCILLDHNNKCLIVFSQKGAILDKITFYSCPWDVTTLDEDKVALTIPDKKEIVVMETEKLTLVQQIKVSNSCTGIASLDGRIVVVCEKTGFLILDRTGSIAATLKCDVSGVRYVVAAFGNIYYTDFIRKTVTCMDMNGKKIFRFQNDNMKYPCDITAIRDEFVLVTGYNSKNVIAIAADGKYHEIVLTHRDGLMYPTAIDYCHETSTLMLCSNRRGTIEIFEMT